MFNAHRFRSSTRIKLMSNAQRGDLIDKLCEDMEQGNVAAILSNDFVYGYRRRKPRKRPGVPPFIRRSVFDRDGNRCVECNSTERLEVDHILAVVFGGSDEISNLQILCRKCNREKGPQSHAKTRRELYGSMQ
jgi:5-methylcytosine-specific restriction endonuclease McrA